MEPVGDDDPSRAKGWFDDLVNHLRSRRHEQVHLRFPIDRHAAEQEHVAHPLAQLGPARLADDDHVACRQRFAQELDLGRLARAFDAFERYEEPFGH